MNTKKYPFWSFGILLNLNTVSKSDCAKWVEAAYRAGANYCVLELGENTPDELISEFTSTCRKRGMYVGFFSKCITAGRIEHLLSAFGRIDYLMLEEEAEASEELKKVIHSLAPGIWLRGPKELKPNVLSAGGLSREETADLLEQKALSEAENRWYEYDYEMLDTRPWYEDDIAVRSAEMISGFHRSATADGMNFLLHVSVHRTREHYAAQLNCLNDLGSKLAPKRSKLHVSKRTWIIFAAVLLLMFSLIRDRYVNRLYGQYQRALTGYRSRVVSASVGKYYYSVIAPSFPRFRSNSGGLYYTIDGKLPKVDGSSVNIIVHVTPYLNKSFDYEVNITLVGSTIAEEQDFSGDRHYLLLLDSNLNPVPQTDDSSRMAYEKYYDYIYRQITTGNEFFGI